MREQVSTELISHYQEGEWAAFDSLFTRYQGQVYRLALAMLRNVQDAEDAVQDIFVGLTRSIRTYDPECGSFDCWLKQVVVNHCRRRQQRGKLLSIPLSLLGRHNNYGADREFDPADLSPTSLPENVAIHHNFVQALWSEVNCLSVKLRTVVVLHYYMDISCGEIAKTLGCSVGTVHSRLFNARQCLQQALSKSKIGQLTI